MKLRMVVLTGAGVSAESGLRTFRDSDGLWEGYNVYEVASPDGWKKDPQLVLDFYNMRRQDILKAQPNAAHTGLADLQAHFDLHIITQNIDDLHERGGARQVWHLHGEITKMRSVLDTERTYPYNDDIRLGDLAADGGQLRPFIVWFGEEVPMIEQAVTLVRQADIFVVIGTSLLVYPAAGLLDIVPRHVPVYVIDKNLPQVKQRPYLHLIEKSATEGVAELKELLQTYIKG
ncbi:Sir2 family NAD-dependent protein deacetylase [Chitinophaga sancti]|uniref:Sir2 family NAD-dependent protein deacetylase n=1 Tax=Chitinophaga sancti TaxID=1004 RepID=UPI002A75B651|nr:Sir2 family NAD-dependent protein deacetylase [Chitinophaga sancti]WPQ60067.1 Sir2 family NAD-dependent protein deacetylase [Chitinophaga sancti]